MYGGKKGGGRERNDSTCREERRWGGGVEKSWHLYGEKGVGREREMTPPVGKKGGGG